MLSRIFVVGMAVTAAMIGSSAGAQSDNEAVLFTHSHFKGYGMRLAGPTRAINDLKVASLQIPPGTAWELCSGKTFTGCKTFNESKASMVMTVRSARPVGSVIPETATASSVVLKGSGASLRGLASEFFVMPSEHGTRVEVGDANALGQQATQFCLNHGWHTSAYQRMQSVGGRNYLADVLCTD